MPLPTRRLREFPTHLPAAGAQITPPAEAWARMRKERKGV